MPLTRPTFSDTWHRVADLRPTLAATVDVRRVWFRGRLQHVLQERMSGRYSRLDEPAYGFVGLLDGRRSVADAWRLACERFGDAAPTQSEAVNMLGQLWQSNLLRGRLHADAQAIFRIQRKRVRREVTGYLTNLLFPRFPLFDPDRLLNVLSVYLGWLFGPMGVALWCVLMGVGLWALAGRAEALWDQSAGVLAVANLPWLFAALVLAKAVHEAGHGLACKRMARSEAATGEVHTVGIMLMALIPLPYVDASSAWSLRSKWRRAFVGAAGMYVELALAAVAAIVWSRTAPGSVPHAVAYNLIFVAGVSTLLFNANPLIRFDGYYILADLIEVPNLYERSKNYLLYLIKRYAYGVRHPRNPAHTRGERITFVLYGLAAAIYRVVLFAGITLFVIETLPRELLVVGLVLALAGMVGWLVVPLGKGVHYLAASPELQRVRTRAVMVTVVILGGLVLPLLVAVPVPDSARATGVVEPRHVQTVFPPADAFLTRPLRSGIAVTPGGDAAGRPLMVGHSPELEAQRDRLLATRDRLDAQVRQAMRDDLAAAAPLERARAAVERELTRVQEQLADLDVRPDIAGTWIATDPERYEGAFAPRSQPLGRVATLDDLVVRAVADQYLGPRLKRQAWEGRRVELRVEGNPRVTYPGVIESVPITGDRTLPSAALSIPAGGDVALSPAPADEAARDTEAAEPFFELRIRPLPTQGDATPLRPGQRVVVRLELPPRPLAQRTYLALRQLLQRRLRL